MQAILHIYRALRVLLKQVIGLEPIVLINKSIPIRYHGNKVYGGWSIPDGFIDKESTVVDVGLGEDISFSQSLIQAHGCSVHGFDPTPKAIDFVEKQNQKNFFLHKFGLGGTSRTERFFLPNRASNVSGSIALAEHLGAQEISVELLALGALLKRIEAESISLLKIDIEGAEYEFIDSTDFEQLSSRIDVLCIEFHHRWPRFGAVATRKAVKTLERAGFSCIWRATASNEEFTFMRTEKIRNFASIGFLK
jgi:FkbM family methyltransferase